MPSTSFSSDFLIAKKYNFKIESSLLNFEKTSLVD